MYTVYILSIAFFACGILLLCGRATFLIAGWNTASREEKEKWNEKKLAIILGTFLLIMANATLVCFLLPNYIPSFRNICNSIFLIISIAGSILVIFLANKYGKKEL